MEWFKEEWVDSDAKALGTYVAMLTSGLKVYMKV